MENVNCAPERCELRQICAQSLLTYSVQQAVVCRLLLVSSHPHFQSPTCVIQQFRCFGLALSLLEQLSAPKDAKPNMEENVNSVRLGLRPYIHSQNGSTLLQKLRCEEWWTSVDRKCPWLLPSTSDLQRSGGYAEHVSILLTTNDSGQTYTMSELCAGENAYKPGDTSAASLARGSSLKFSIYACYAPSFDNESCATARDELRTILCRRREKSAHHAWTAEFNEAVPRELHCAHRKEGTRSLIDLCASMQLFPSDLDAAKGYQELPEIAMLESEGTMNTAAENVQFQRELDELLTHAANILIDLSSLQVMGSEASQLHSTAGEIGFQELGKLIMQAICTLGRMFLKKFLPGQRAIDCLTVMISVRPRASQIRNVPLIPQKPPVYIFHEMLTHDTPSGWRGTLQEHRCFALRDNETFKQHINVPTTNLIEAVSHSSALLRGGYTLSSHDHIGGCGPVHNPIHPQYPPYMYTSWYNHHQFEMQSKNIIPSAEAPTQPRFSTNRKTLNAVANTIKNDERAGRNAVFASLRMPLRARPR